MYDIPVEIEEDEDGIRKKTVSIMIRKTDKGSSSGESITGETGIY